MSQPRGHTPRLGCCQTIRSLIGNVQLLIERTFTLINCSWLLSHMEKHYFKNPFSSVSSKDKIHTEQECIPVRCIPSAAVAVSPAMHAPQHACPHHACPHPLQNAHPLHACPLFHTCPFAMHTPFTMLVPPCEQNHRQV